MKRHLFSVLSVSAVITAGALIAPQVFAHGPAQMFEKFDTNKDGKITRAEAHAQVLEPFRNADANRDNTVTQEEARKHHEAKMNERRDPEKSVEAQFKAHDTNKNGKLERSESRLVDPIFTKIDKNGDNAISEQEALDARREHMAKRGEHKGARGAKDGTVARGKQHKRRGESPFARIDTSGDGKITEAEAKGAADRVFSRIDQNKDNVITRAEVSQMRKDHRPNSRGKGHEKKQK